MTPKAQTKAALKAHAAARRKWPGVTATIDDRGGLYRFDEARADLACDFFSEYLRHFEGEHAGKPFELLDWQRELLIRPLFGWVRCDDGARRFRRVFLEIGKKNGKSGLCSGLGLLLAFADGEPGAQVFCAAGAEEQARIVFRPSAEMARNSPDLLADFGVEVLTNAIEQASSASFLRPLTSKAKTQHGLNVHALIFDEFHAQKDRELWETLYRGISARRQPVVVIITTAGDDRESICREEYERACKVRDGVLVDDSFLPIVFEALPTDDWKSEETWRKANPSLGVTKRLDYMRDECAAAIAEPRKRNAFLRLELNIWTESRTVWISPESWAECKREVPEPPDLGSLACCLGLDLSETTDLTALVAAFKRPDPRPADEVEVEGETEGRKPRVVSIDFSVDLKAWFWLPRDMLLERSKRDGVPYDLWAREGWLQVTDGAIIDYRAIRKVILEQIRPKYRIVEAGFDPYNARQLCTVLAAEDGLPMVEVRQGFLSLSAPSKLFEGLVRARRITHDGNPVLRWCVANAEVISDPAGNIKPVKPGGDSRGSRRIDGVTATVTALSRLMVAPEPKRSAYADRGVQVIRW